MEIEVLKNTKTKRLIFVDKQTSMAITSFGKENWMYDYLFEYHRDEIKDHNPMSYLTTNK